MNVPANTGYIYLQGVSACSIFSMQVLEPLLFYHWASVWCCTTVKWHIMCQYRVQQVSHTSGGTSSDSLPATVPPAVFNAICVTHPVGHAAAMTSNAYSLVSSHQVQSATCWGRYWNTSIDEEVTDEKLKLEGNRRAVMLLDGAFLISIWAESTLKLFHKFINGKKKWISNLLKFKNLNSFISLPE